MTNEHEWQDLWPEKSERLSLGASANAATGTAVLRVFSKTQGYLNAEARHALFGSEGVGSFKYQRRVGKAPTLSILAVEGRGYKVGKGGHINVAVLVALGVSPGSAFKLEADPGEPGRLLFVDRLVTGTK